MDFLEQQFFLGDRDRFRSDLPLCECIKNLGMYLFLLIVAYPIVGIDKAKLLSENKNRV